MGVHWQLKLIRIIVGKMVNFQNNLNNPLCLCWVIKKWSLHLKLNLSFEVCELCADKQKNHIPWEERMKLLWVFKVSNCHIAYAIGAEFHHVNLKVKLDFIGIFLKIIFNFILCFFMKDK